MDICSVGISLCRETASDYPINELWEVLVIHLEEKFIVEHMKLMAPTTCGILMAIINLLSKFSENMNACLIKLIYIISGGISSSMAALTGIRDLLPSSRYPTIIVLLRLSIISLMRLKITALHCASGISITIAFFVLN